MEYDNKQAQYQVPQGASLAPAKPRLIPSHIASLFNLTDNLIQSLIELDKRLMAVQKSDIPNENSVIDDATKSTGVLMADELEVILRRVSIAQAYVTNMLDRIEL
jgi:hypothetical protein